MRSVTGFRYERSPDRFGPKAECRLPYVPRQAVAKFIVASDRCKTVRRAFGKHYLQEQYAGIGPTNRGACGQR